MRTRLFIFAIAVILMASCKDSNRTLQQLAEQNLRQSVEYPQQLQIMAVSEPDSAFGTNYFSPKEKDGILHIMRSVTDSIMRRTNNMQSFDINDFYVMDLAERQMRSNAEIRDMMRLSKGKGEWSGWKVKIDYSAKSHHGLDYHAERWFFINKEGNSIIRTIELPLP